MTPETFRVLVVEDEREMRQFFSDFCSVNGYGVKFAANGFHALKLMEQEMLYGLAIVDFLMPEMDGVEFVLKARKKWATLPIIAMSAFDDVKYPFLEAGAFLFLKKPFDPHFLERAVERIARYS